MDTQVPGANLWPGVHPPEMQHAPLAFVSDSFTNSKLRSATQDGGFRHRGNIPEAGLATLMGTGFLH